MDIAGGSNQVMYLCNVLLLIMMPKRKFAKELKLADITPLHKKLENISKGNYRPVSLLHSFCMPNEANGSNQ